MSEFTTTPMGYINAYRIEISRDPNHLKRYSGKVTLGSRQLSIEGGEIRKDFIPCTETETMTIPLRTREREEVNRSVVELLKQNGIPQLPNQFISDLTERT